jgi:hypothetical protein
MKKSEKSIFILFRLFRFPFWSLLSRWAMNASIFVGDWRLANQQALKERQQQTAIDDQNLDQKTISASWMESCDIDDRGRLQ